MMAQYYNLLDLVVTNKGFLFISEFGFYYTIPVILSDVSLFSFIHTFLIKPEYNGDALLSLY